MEAAILLPALMLLSLLVLQATLWHYARATMTTAANKGVDAARVETGTADAGRAAAEEFVRHAPLRGDPEIDATRGTETARVEVSGEVVSVVFGVPLFSATGAAEAPVERRLP